MYQQKKNLNQNSVDSLHQFKKECDIYTFFVETVAIHSLYSSVIFFFLLILIDSFIVALGFKSSFMKIYTKIEPCVSEGDWNVYGKHL